MKKYIISVLLSLLTITTYAQQTLVATLVHGDDMSAYYGTDAFKQAHEAATNGDILTLSPGVFNSCEINKAITIRGNGYETIDSIGQYPTVLVGEIAISKSDDETDELVTIEGILFDNNFYFNDCNKSCTLKNCLFHVFRRNTIRPGGNLSLIDCKIDNYIHYDNSTDYSVYITNCIINKPSFKNIYIDHCVFTDYSPQEFSDCVIYNSIFANTVYESLIFRSNNDIHNCLAYKGSSSIFSDINNNTNMRVEENPFTEGTYAVWELNDQFLNFPTSDGTQVGIYGGTFPFTTDLRLPTITKFNVSPRSTPEGKLNVEIEAKLND